MPPPWTPVVVERDVIRCWGRRQTVGGAAPAQIASRGKRLLTGPIAFRLGGATRLDWKRERISADAREAAWDSTARWGDAVARARTRVEYDGFWQVDVEFGAGSYEALSMEIPLAARHARYLHFVNETHYQETNTFSLPEREGELWSDRFAAMVWLGDERVGLAWCADTEAPFHLRQPQRALTVHRAGSTVTLRVNLIDHPVTLAKPLAWRFGLMATPVRPLPKGWRDWRLGPGATANMQNLWWNAWTGSHAELTPKDPAALREQAAKVRAAGQHLLPYTAPQALSERSEVYRRGGEAWRREPFSKLEDEGTPYWIMCPNTPWRDYFPRQVERLCREYGVNGLYYDFTFPYRCEAAHHPCGHVDARGNRHGEFRIFALRRLMQAAYERVKRVNPEARILAHTSGALMYPYIGFADMMLNGEQLRQPLARAGGHTMEVLPLDVLRAEYRGEQAGLAPFLIPQLASPEGFPDPKLTSIPGPTNELLALTLLHDIGVWPIYCHLETVEAVRKAQRDFGLAEARFLPYWENRGPAAITDPEVQVSAWARREEWLLVAVNRRDQAKQTRLRLQPRVTRRKLSAARDALTGEKLPLTGNAVLLDIPPRSFRLLRLSTRVP